MGRRHCDRVKVNEKGVGPQGGWPLWMVVMTA